MSGGSAELTSATAASSAASVSWANVTLTAYARHLVSFAMVTMTHDSDAPTGSGWVFALVSAAAFGLSGALGRGLMDAGWSAAAAVAVRVLLGAAVLAPVAIAQLRGRWYLVRRHLPLVAAYGAVPVAGCQLAYFTAVKHVPVGVALLIEYTAPVAVVGWLWLRRGQRPTRLTVAGAALGVAGLLLVIDLTGGTTSAVGILWSLVAMVGAACYFLLSSRDVGGLPGTVLAAGGLLVGGVLLLLAGLAGLRPVHGLRSRRSSSTGSPCRGGSRSPRSAWSPRRWPTAAGSPPPAASAPASPRSSRCPRCSPRWCSRACSWARRRPRSSCSAGCWSSPGWWPCAAGSPPPRETPPARDPGAWDPGA